MKQAGRRGNRLGLPGAAGSGVIDDAREVERSDRAPGSFDRWLLRQIARMAGDPPLAMALWDGQDAYRPRGRRVGRVVFRDRRALWRVVVAPELGFGDGYSTGSIEIEGDLVEVLREAYRAVDRAGPDRFKRNLIGRRPRPATNTRTGSRRHIHHHYDLGNDFYRLWLDERMVYTCAYYPRAHATLEEAQVAKLDHVSRKLELRPGQRVVEAGCGWGALALHMARHYGVTVRAYNISAEQVRYARERARAEGLDHRVEFVEDDYRNITGTYDAFVSVGMLEHVGPEHYETLGSVIARVLREDGLGLVHSVGRSRPAPVNAWLEQRIFPGSYPPSLREMMGIFEPHGFSVLDVENLRVHYARTLMHWLERFDARIDEIRAMYDEPFVRAWRLYLAGCAAAFLASSIQLFQVLFAHPAHNRLALTRAHVYTGAEPPRWELE